MWTSRGLGAASSREGNMANSIVTASVSWTDNQGVHLRVYSSDGYKVTERCYDEGAWTTGGFAQQGSEISATIWQQNGGPSIRVYCALRTPRPNIAGIRAAAAGTRAPIRRAESDLRHCERSEAIQCASEAAGLLRRHAPRNDDQPRQGRRYSALTGRGWWASSRATKVNRPSVTLTSSRPRSRLATTSIRIAIEVRPIRSTRA